MTTVRLQTESENSGYALMLPVTEDATTPFMTGNFKSAEEEYRKKANGCYYYTPCSGCVTKAEVDNTCGAYLNVCAAAEVSKSAPDVTFGCVGDACHCESNNGNDLTDGQNVLCYANKLSSGHDLTENENTTLESIKKNYLDNLDKLTKQDVQDGCDQLLSSTNEKNVVNQLKIRKWIPNFSTCWSNFETDSADFETLHSEIHSDV